MKSCSTWMRRTAASPVAVRMTGDAGGIAAASRITVAGRIDATGSFCGLGDRLRTLDGGRARMMPLCGGAAAVLSGW